MAQKEGAKDGLIVVVYTDDPPKRAPQAEVDSEGPKIIRGDGLGP